MTRRFAPRRVGVEPKRFHICPNPFAAMPVIHFLMKLLQAFFLLPNLLCLLIADSFPLPSLLLLTLQRPAPLALPLRRNRKTKHNIVQAVLDFLPLAVRPALT